MANINAVGNALTGSTGSGAFVGATSPTLVTPALGTPSSGTLTNCTGLPVAGGGTGASSFTAYAPVIAGTTSTGAFQSASTGQSTAGYVWTSNGSSAAPSFQQITSGSGSWSFIQSQDASASSSLSFTSGLSSSFRAYKIIITNVRPATSATDQVLLTSTNGGSSYLSAYYYCVTYAGSASSTPKGDAVLAASQFYVTSGQTNYQLYSSGGNLSGEIFINSAYDSSTRAAIISHVSYVNAANTAGVSCMSIGYCTPTSPINAIRVQMASGNITSGNYTLWGLSA